MLITSVIYLSSCSTTYMVTSAGESFDALTKITDGDKVCLYPCGGDNGSNLVFSAKETDGYFNVYMKDNVLTKAIIQKTAGGNLNLYPDYCDSNKNIVFQYYATDNFDIYYVNAEKGKAITQVTNTDENEYCPSWSRDGSLIAFEKGLPPKYFLTTNKLGTITKSVKITSNQMWIKNIKTGELKMIGEGSYPKISPDGTKVAYIKYELNKGTLTDKGTIWVMNIDGESPKQITTSDLGNASLPSWSPDGKKLVFTLTKKNKKDADIYSIDVDGEQLKQHTTNASNDFAPYWSTDGFIYFASDRGGKMDNFQIWRFKI